MARAAKTTKTPMPARKAARQAPAVANRPRTAPAPAKTPKQGPAGKANVAVRTVTKAPRAAARVPAAPPAPKVSKDELRAQVEKLQLLVAALRAKSRETNKAAKAASARIVELEASVADLEKKASAVPVADEAPSPMKTPRAKRQARKPNKDAPETVTAAPAPLDMDTDVAAEDASATGEQD